MRSQAIETIFFGLALANRAVADTEPLSTFDSPDCPGVFREVGDETSECCVGGHIQTSYLSTCKGWPLCTGSATTAVTSTPLSCSTVVTFAVSGSTNAEYSSLVSETSASLRGITPSGSAGASATASATAGSGSGANGSGRLAIQLGLVAGAVLGLAIML